MKRLISKKLFINLTIMLVCVIIYAYWKGVVLKNLIRQYVNSGLNDINIEQDFCTLNVYKSCFFVYMHSINLVNVLYLSKEKESVFIWQQFIRK